MNRYESDRWRSPERDQDSPRGQRQGRDYGSGGRDYEGRQDPGWGRSDFSTDRFGADEGAGYFGTEGGANWGRGYSRESQSPGSYGSGHEGRGRPEPFSREEYRSRSDIGSVASGEGFYGGSSERNRGYVGYGYGPREERRYAQGPKGYSRSDDRVKEDICERLMSQYDVDSSEVTVNVKDGEVSLEGTVPERWMRLRIEDIADRCGGVKEVDNRIRVQRDMGSSAERSTLQGQSTASQRSAASTTSGGRTKQ